MARFYADENFPLEVTEALRTLGHGVVTAHDAGQANRALPDEAVLGYGTSRSLCVLTMNRWDFIALHSRSTAHAGIVVCTRDPEGPTLARRIDDAVRALPSLAGQLVRIQRTP